MQLCLENVLKTLRKTIKTILSQQIWPKKFGFLSDIKILDAVELTHECIHIIKSKKKNVSHEIDLIWAYDKVD